MRVFAFRRNAAFTLAELLVSLGICAMLLMGLGSAILLAARAVPGRASPAVQVSSAARGLDLLATELYYAQSFSSLGPNSVTFTVAPRGTDTQPETITYSWSGKAGDPLMRQYNAGAAVPVVNGIASFGLTYNRRAVTTTTKTTSTSTTPEQLLASFTAWSDGWPVVSSTFPLSSTQQICEYFKLNAAPPSGATSFQITRVVLLLEAWPGGGQSFTVGLYKPGNAPAPSSSVIAGPVNISASVLTGSYNWTNIYFNNALIGNPSQDFCLVVNGPGTFPAAAVEYLTDVNAAVQTDMMQQNTGGGWGPPPPLCYEYAMPFYCYGSWLTSSTTTQTATDYYLQSVGVAIQRGTGSAAPLNTTVEVYTQPKVTSLSTG